MTGLKWLYASIGTLIGATIGLKLGGIVAAQYSSFGSGVGEFLGIICGATIGCASAILSKSLYDNIELQNSNSKKQLIHLGRKELDTQSHCIQKALPSKSYVDLIMQQKATPSDARTM